MNLTHEYAMELAELDRKIYYFKALLTAKRFDSISINFFTERSSSSEKPFYHAVRQDSFTIDLSHELAMLFNEQLTILLAEKESMLNNHTTWQLQKDVFELTELFNQQNKNNEQQ